MRYLYFEGEGAALSYKMLNDGIIATQDGVQGHKDVRTLSKTLDKLESIAIKNDKGDFELVGTEMKVVGVEDREHEQLVEMLEKVRWHPKFVRDADVMLTIVNEAPSKERGQGPTGE